MVKRAMGIDSSLFSKIAPSTVSMMHSFRKLSTITKSTNEKSTADTAKERPHRGCAKLLW
jgi:hypothetical protein